MSIIIPERNIEAILLDHGNVLSRDSGPDVPQICQYFEDVYGLNLNHVKVAETLREILTPLQEGRILEEEFWRDFLRQLDVKDVAVRDRVWKEAALKYNLKMEFNPEALELITFLKERVPKVGLLSNTVQSHTELNRERGRFIPFGENVFLSCELGYKKPKPEIYQLACRLMKADQKKQFL